MLLDARSLSWDKNYLKPIAMLSSFYWDEILRAQHLTSRDVTSILKLHNDYQKVLKKMRILYDSLKSGEALGSQKELQNETVRRREELHKLLNKQAILTPKIKKLQHALDRFAKKYLDAKLKDIERIGQLQEKAADLRTLLQVAKEVRNLEKKLKSTTGVSFEHAHLLLQINVTEALEAKSRFAQHYIS